MAGHYNKNRVTILGYTLVPQTMKSVVDMRHNVVKSNGFSFHSDDSLGRIYDLNLDSDMYPSASRH